MIPSEVHHGECPICQQQTAHPDQVHHRRINLVLSRLDEQQRRWYVASESERLGPGGDELLWQITGMDPKTIQREQISVRYGLTVTVCHYPTGWSKWNPLEHRLFSQISLNWAGKPLRSLDSMLNYIRGTTTQTGLTVRTALLEGTSAKGPKVSDEQRQQLNSEHHSECGQWNYTIRPRHAALSEATHPSERKKVIF